MRVSVTNRHWRGGNKNGGSRLSTDLYRCQVAPDRVAPTVLHQCMFLQTMSKNAADAYV